MKKAHWWERRRRLEIPALAWGLLIMNLTQNLLVAMFYHFFPTSFAFSALSEFWFVVLCVLVKVKKVNPCITSVCLNTATVWLCAMNLQSRKSDLCNDFFSWNKNLKASMARGGCKTLSLDFLHSSL